MADEQNLRPFSRRDLLASGLRGAGLLALSPFAIYYSTEARAYTLAALFVLLAALIGGIALARRDPAEEGEA